MKRLEIVFSIVIVCLCLICYDNFLKIRKLNSLIHSHQSTIDGLVSDSHPIKFRLKKRLLSDAYSMGRSNEYCEAVLYALTADSLISLEGDDLRFLKIMQKECDKIEKLKK